MIRIALVDDDREHLKMAQQFPGRNGKCRSARINNRAAPATRGNRFAEDKQHLRASSTHPGEIQEGPAGPSCVVCGKRFPKERGNRNPLSFGVSFGYFSGRAEKYLCEA